MSDSTNKPDAPEGYRWVSRGELNTPQLLPKDSDCDVETKEYQIAAARIYTAVATVREIKDDTECGLCISALEGVEPNDADEWIRALVQLQQIKSADTGKEIQELGEGTILAEYIAEAATVEPESW